MSGDIVLLPKTWGKNGTFDPIGWLMSEKLDGIRGVWTGKEFLSRKSNRFPAPDYFCADIPSNVVLDGEIWLGRGKFQTCSGIVRNGSFDRGWGDLCYMVFDAPELKMPFEQRLVFLEKHLAGRKRCRVVPHVRCEGRDHLDEALANVCRLNGEGLMLRKAGSMYLRGRNNTLWKIKKFDDNEAVVVAYEPGKGKYQGAMGALRCRLPDGTLFEIGTGFDDSERDNPPKIGAMVTFKHQGYTDGGKVPRGPCVFIGVRDYE